MARCAISASRVCARDRARDRDPRRFRIESARQRIDAGPSRARRRARRARAEGHRPSSKSGVTRAAAKRDSSAVTMRSVSIANPCRRDGAAACRSPARIETSSKAPTPPSRTGRSGSNSRKSLSANGQHQEGAKPEPPDAGILGRGQRGLVAAGQQEARKRRWSGSWKPAKPDRRSGRDHRSPGGWLGPSTSEPASTAILTERGACRRNMPSVTISTPSGNERGAGQREPFRAARCHSTSRDRAAGRRGDEPQPNEKAPRQRAARIAAAQGQHGDGESERAAEIDDRIRHQAGIGEAAGHGPRPSWQEPAPRRA